MFFSGKTNLLRSGESTCADVAGRRGQGVDQDTKEGRGGNPTTAHKGHVKAAGVGIEVFSRLWLCLCPFVWSDPDF